jgi:predicted nucleotidyltransferase
MKQKLPVSRSRLALFGSTLKKEATTQSDKA